MGQKVARQSDDPGLGASGIGRFTRTTTNAICFGQTAIIHICAVIHFTSEISVILKIIR